VGDPVDVVAGVPTDRSRAQKSPSLKVHASRPA
jgi:hypothetical protein